jgi:hypothetical protein
MKQLLQIVFAVCVALGTQYAYAGGELKEVCETVKDKKTNKDKQVCKKIKTHKKVEGEKVPTK